MTGRPIAATPRVDAPGVPIVRVGRLESLVAA